jgi:hypothetical protein
VGVVIEPAEIRGGAMVRSIEAIKADILKERSAFSPHRQHDRHVQWPQAGEIARALVAAGCEDVHFMLSPSPAVGAYKLHVMATRDGKRYGVMFSADTNFAGVEKAAERLLESFKADAA